MLIETYMSGLVANKTSNKPKARTAIEIYSCLNLDNLNAELIEMDFSQKERLIKLNKSAKKQLELFKNNRNIKQLELLDNKINDQKYI